MEDPISNSINSFSEFLTEMEPKLKKRNSGVVLVSFVMQTANIPFENKNDFLLKLYERSFYFEKPKEDFSIIGINEILTISENGEGRFAITDKKIKEWKNNFVNNWETIPLKKIPLFLGAMKFTPEHNEEIWQDYNDSTWFVPEVMLLKENSNQYLFFNFTYSQGTSKNSILKKFQNKVEKIFSGESRNVSSDQPKVIGIEGNTPKDKKKWKNLVSEGIQKIRENQIEKIVLSRKVQLKLSEEPNMDYILSRLKSSYPECYLFIYHHGKSSFFGATPEKLAEFSEGNVEIDALAGSAPRGLTDDEDKKIEDELLKDSKNLSEHNFVVTHIKSSIINLTNDLILDENHKIKKLANIQHILTKITAKINAPNTMLNLLKELYPTPAICGNPKDTSLHLIKKMEGYRRGLYSGIIGWFNFNDEGDFAVAIRSALSTNNKVIAFAGCGIVEDSDPESEFKETELKLKTIMSLFINENKN